MYSLKVIAISKSGKSVLASVTKKVAMFTSEVAVGSIKVDADHGLVVGQVVPLEGITKVSTRVSTADATEQAEAKEFNWLVLE